MVGGLVSQFGKTKECREKSGPDSLIHSTFSTFEWICAKEMRHSLSQRSETFVSVFSAMQSKLQLVIDYSFGVKNGAL